MLTHNFFLGGFSFPKNGKNPSQEEAGADQFLLLKAKKGGSPFEFCFSFKSLI